jgi:AcrR family transcriptional regulator
MGKEAAADVRRATAERNRASILDAAEGLLRQGDQLSFASIAAASGLSRPTVYAHFADRSQLLAALVDRTVRQATAEIAGAQPDKGPPVEALRRVLRASWEQLARHHDIARAAGAEVPDHAFHSAHHDVRVAMERLIRRGRSEGAFRTDLPVTWLVTSTLALIHAAAAVVQSGAMDSRRSLELLTITVQDLYVGQNRSSEPPHGVACAGPG